MDHYQYSALPSGAQDIFFRLLTLLPACASPYMCCLISVESVSVASDYEALSYCYGAEAADQRIFVKNASEPGPFRQVHIRPNLFAALRQLRHENEPRKLWIDSLCINQEDLAEKATQIQCMRFFYKQAAKVIIWLGEAADDSHAALQLVVEINMVSVQDFLSGITRDLGQPLDLPHQLPALAHPIWSGLYKVIRRPWFKRAWIVQELVMARVAVVRCGEVELLWDLFHAAFEYLWISGKMGMYHAAVEYTRLDLLMQTRQSVDPNVPTNSLLHLLLRFRSQEASDARDAVFAFHGLFEPGSAASMATRPCYTIDCREVYLNTAYGILNDTGNLDLLTAARCSDRPSQPGLPTWVPDWQLGDTSSALALLAAMGDALHDDRLQQEASAGSHYTLHLSDNDTKLHLRGYHIADIARISQPYKSKSPKDSSGWFEYSDMVSNTLAFDGLEEVAFCNIDGVDWWHYPDTGETLVDAFWKTLICNAPLHGGTLTTDADACDMFWAMYASVMLLRAIAYEAGRDGTDPAVLVQRHIEAEVERQMEDLEEMLLLRDVMADRGLKWTSKPDKTSRVNAFRIMTCWCDCRRMMKTNNGWIGLAPQLAAEGDMVILAQGGRTPYVLRKTASRARAGREPDGPEYEFIGEAYVHGIMGGQEWTRRRINGDEMQEFVLI